MIAEMCHEANRIFCAAHGDYSHKPWAHTPLSIQNSAVHGVNFLIENPDKTPAELHAEWRRSRLADGWRYGEVKDVEKKTHPSLINEENGTWWDLPYKERYKDQLFKNIVAAMTTMPLPAEPKKDFSEVLRQP